VQEAIFARKRAKQIRERKQRELLSKEDLWHNTICSKLESLGIELHAPILSSPDQFGEREITGYRIKFPWLLNFFRCGTESIKRVCRSCGDSHTFTINCSQKWCPRCQWKLSKARVDIISRWAKTVARPIHLVLTQRNFHTLTKSKLREHVRNLGKIRRQKCFEQIAGGTISVEITNEGRGWHLHSHWLLQTHKPSCFNTASKLFDFQSTVAKKWGALVDQEFAIVKAKPVTDSDYVGECAKYVAKSDEVARWTPEEVWEYANAIRGRRFFFTFGSLTQLRRQITADIAKDKPEQQPCDCGSSSFVFKPA